MSEKIFFDRPERTTEVEMEEGSKIGSGSYSEVREVEVAVGNKIRTFVLKKFKDNDMGTAQENALRAFKNHQRAKAAGLKVFPTYRISEEQDSILMTDGRKGVWFCAAGNNDIQTEEYVEEIENLDVLVEKLRAEALKATAAGISLQDDVPFFTVDQDTHTTLDFYLGDIDLLPMDATGYNAYLTMFNLRAMRTALDNFVATYVPAGERRNEYRIRIQQLFGASDESRNTE